MTVKHPISIVHSVGGLLLEQGGPSVNVPRLCQSIREVSTKYTPTIISHLPENESGRLSPDLSGIDVLWSAKQDFRKSFCDSILSARKNSVRVILHDHGQWLRINRVSASCSRSLNVSRIVSPRGMLSPWSLNHKKWKKRLAWLLFARRDLESSVVIHATSQLEADELRALGLKKPIAVIANGVDQVRFGIEERQGFRRPYCLFMSRIHEKKGILELLEVWRKMNLQTWDLVIAGPDEQGILSRIGLPENAQYLGTLSGTKKFQILRDASLFVLPTHSENFGVVIAEALMAEVPVITTYGAPWKGLEENGCGWWIPISKTALLDAMTKATSLSSTYLREMGCKGAEWVKREFEWSAIGKQMTEVYEWMESDLDDKPACVQLFNPA